MPKKDLIFILISITIILSIITAVFIQFRINACQKVKGDYIKQNLPTFEGPEMKLEERQAQTRLINDKYNSCFFPWK